MICWDVSFPETARTLAQKGAEVIFLPIWGGNLTLTKARAIENQVYIVSSSYDMISAVFDQEGEVLKQATTGNPVVVTEVDLSKQKLWPWLGDFKNRIPTEMPPQKAIQDKSY
jgi:predicted amidohydrolase